MCRFLAPEKTRLTRNARVHPLRLSALKCLKDHWTRSFPSFERLEGRSVSRSPAAAAGLAACGEPLRRSGAAALGCSAAARCADRKMRAPPRSGARLAICGWARWVFKRDLDAVGGGGQERQHFTRSCAGFNIQPGSLGLARVCLPQISCADLASSCSIAAR